jgi:hypothetical protein
MTGINNCLIEFQNTTCAANRVGILVLYLYFIICIGDVILYPGYLMFSMLLIRLYLSVNNDLNLYINLLLITSDFMFVLFYLYIQNVPSPVNMFGLCVLSLFIRFKNPSKA